MEKGKLWMMQKVVILPFTVIVVKGAAKLMMHSKCVNVIVKPIVSYSDHISTAISYGVLRLPQNKSKWKGKENFWTKLIL